MYKVISKKLKTVLYKVISKKDLKLFYV